MAGKKNFNPQLLLVLFGVGVLVIIVVLQINRRGATEAGSAAIPDSLVASEERSNSRSVQVNAIHSEDNKPSRRLASRSPQTTSPAEPEPTPAYEPVESKRSFYADNFQNPNFSLDGYRVEGLVRTEQGLTLPPSQKKEGASGEEEEIRKGVIESPTIPLEFPSNFMMPLWRHMSNEGGNLTVEMTISPDGQEWSRWFPLEPNSDEIAPTYPDGRPNPNYGFQGGNGIANGTRLYPFAKYRVTMTSGEPEAAPVLQEFKIFHVDSTGQNGVLAEKAYSTAGHLPGGQGAQP